MQEKRKKDGPAFDQESLFPSRDIFKRSERNCHPDETGAFNDATYESLVHLTAWFCEKYDLTTSDIIRHYDVTGKNCPLYYVEHPDARQQFLNDVETYSLTNGEGT